jgi:hypothetical protein
MRTYQEIIADIKLSSFNDADLDHYTLIIVGKYLDDILPFEEWRTEQMDAVIVGAGDLYPLLYVAALLSAKKPSDFITLVMEQEKITENDLPDHILRYLNE